MSAHFYPHRYLSDTALVARLAVIAATLSWAVLVLWQDAGFTQTYRALGLVMDENLWGGFYLAIGLFQLARTWLQSPPCVAGHAINAALAFLWTYTTLGFLLFWPHPPIGGFSACATVMCLSFVNVLALPKKRF